MLKSTFSRRIGLAVAAIALGTLGSSTGAGAAPASPPGPPSQEPTASTAGSRISEEAVDAGRKAHGRNPTAQEALEAYWTPDRMRQAKPVEDDPALAAAGERYSKKLEEQAKSKAARGPQPKPGPQVDLQPGAGAQESTQAAYNPNLGTWHPTARTSGKVFFSKADGNYVCSGTIVNTEGRDSVWTAGHCVHGGQGGGWHWNWTFVPSYDDDLANPRPYGTWSYSTLTTLNAWINSSDFTADIGVATMNTLNSWHIADYFGGQGLSVNQGKEQYVYAFGYPAESPFDGGNLQRCSGTTSPETSSWFWSSETLKLSCDMTRGSSGGAWFRAYDGNWGYLYGVNSRINRITGPTLMFSPYFDDTALSLLNNTRYL